MGSRSLVPLRLFTHLAIAGALSALAVRPAMADGQCWARCLAGTPCELAPSSTTLMPSCEGLKPGKGRIQVSYVHQNVLVTAEIDAAHPVSALLRQAPPDPCNGSLPDCTQRKMDEMPGAPGGHGADGREGRPGGTGRPCTYWLPCGAIVVPKARAWTIRFRDPSFQGALALSIIRAPHGEVMQDRRLPFGAGRIPVPEGLLIPAAIYGYRLLDPGGKAIATGEFRVLPTAEEASVRSEADASVKNGNSSADAWLEAFGSEDLEWNFNQVLVGGELP
jgi:hypothetical protein